MLIDVTLPQLGESVSEGTISKWLVREGDVVKKDQPLVSIATDKADSEMPAPAAGRVTKLLAVEGQVVPVKTVIAQIEEGADGGATLSVAPGAPVSLPPAGSPPPVSRTSQPSRRAPFAAGVVAQCARHALPCVRKAALEHDVDLSSVQGTGGRGRVTRDDVMRAAGTGDFADAIAAIPAPARAARRRPPTVARLQPPRVAAHAAARAAHQPGRRLRPADPRRRLRSVQGCRRIGRPRATR